jgi:hypothetical protein
LYREKAAEYLKSDYTGQYNALGFDGVHNLIELGIRKATEHGIELESDVCELIGVMAEFGGGGRTGVGFRHPAGPVRTGRRANRTPHRVGRGVAAPRRQSLMPNPFKAKGGIKKLNDPASQCPLTKAEIRVEVYGIDPRGQEPQQPIDGVDVRVAGATATKPAKTANSQWRYQPLTPGAYTVTATFAPDLNERV